ncbi:hypothetical protein T4D_4187, partial [Trichinella pseudospiralis]
LDVMLDHSFRVSESTYECLSMNWVYKFRHIRKLGVVMNSCIELFPK